MWNRPYMCRFLVLGGTEPIRTNSEDSVGSSRQEEGGRGSNTAVFFCFLQRCGLKLSKRHRRMFVYPQSNGVCPKRSTKTPRQMRP
ncbi:hypothetical protein KSP40_PGU012134 [Platanthera guangdongensis]|uniref:Secreted protein n=1 Tax=Platanthera guangdongensis TaxID=2320717 RepID=A0ABR2MWR8_9ASPA